MIWNYVETVGLVSLYVSLHAVFRNLIALVITSGKTAGSYRELQVSRKLEHGPRHYNTTSPFPFREVIPQLYSVINHACNPSLILVPYHLQDLKINLIWTGCLGCRLT